MKDIIAKETWEELFDFDSEEDYRKILDSLIYKT